MGMPKHVMAAAWFPGLVSLLSGPVAFGGTRVMKREAVAEDGSEWHVSSQEGNRRLSVSGLCGTMHV